MNLVSIIFYLIYYYNNFFYFFYIVIATVYLSLITVVSIYVFYLTLTPDFHTPNKRSHRALLFLSLGVSTAIPIFHLEFWGEFVTGLDPKPQLIHWYLGGLAYVFAGVIFKFKIPEKYFPGKFDYFGNSNQILHTFVDIAFLLHYFGALESYYYRIDHQCPVVRQ